MKPVKVYQYEACSTCKKALKFLDQKKIPYQKISIVESPPSKAELMKVLECVQGDLKKLFNTSGMVYREMKLSEKLQDLSQEEALKLLCQNGKLIKRPLLIKGDQGVVGFREAEWKEFLSS
jgi:arsenate reductase